MKKFLLISLITFLLLLNNISVISVHSEQNLKELQNEILNIEKDLNLIQEKLKILKENLFYTKRLIVFTLIKEKILKSNFIFFDTSEEYFELRKKFLLYSNLYYTFYNNLIKKEENYQKLNLLYHKKLEESKKLKEKLYEKLINTKNQENPQEKNITSINKTQKFIIFDPITGKAIKEGKYKKKIQVGTPVFSPFDGVIKKIGFFDGILSITVENNKCYALLSGFSVLSIFLGEAVKAKEKLGEVGFSEESYNFYYEIYCSK